MHAVRKALRKHGFCCYCTFPALEDSPITESEPSIPKDEISKVDGTNPPEWKNVFQVKARKPNKSELLESFTDIARSTIASLRRIVYDQLSFDSSQAAALIGSLDPPIRNRLSDQNPLQDS